jgi:hypothetical protein
MWLCTFFNFCWFVRFRSRGCTLKRVSTDACTNVRFVIRRFIQLEAHIILLMTHYVNTFMNIIYCVHVGVKWRHLGKMYCSYDNEARDVAW